MGFAVRIEIATGARGSVVAPILPRFTVNSIETIVPEHAIMLASPAIFRLSL